MRTIHKLKIRSGVKTMKKLQFVFMVMTAVLSAPSASAATEPDAATAGCRNSSAQHESVRTRKDKKQVVIEVFDVGSQGWRVVFRSIDSVVLPRRSPDKGFLAYVSNENGQSRLYLQRLSTGWRELVAQVDPAPLELCFDATNSVVHIVDRSGAVTDHGISKQMKLLQHE